MRNAAIALVLAAAVAPALQAQSLYNAAGMGLPIEAIDGRARAMGSLGVGLPGAAFMPTDPAALARYRIPTGVFVSQPSWVEFSEEGGGAGDFQGNRFPLMGLAYPLFNGMMSVQVGSFLDQHFRTEVTGSVDLEGVPVSTTDLFDQNGSVSNLNIGYAWLVGGSTAVGATFGRYGGSVTRTLTRSFEDESIEVESYVESGKWSYRGHSVTAGVSTDVLPGVRLAGSVQIPTSLSADASETTSGGDGSFDLPIQLRVGASARLAPGLLIAASAAFADWSGIEDDLAERVSVQSANGFGVGLELSRARILGKQAPLRFGYRRTGLPFSFPSGDATERIFAGGLGLALNETNEILLASADFGLERGQRSGGGVTEDFWRLTISLVVSGG